MTDAVLVRMRDLIQEDVGNRGLRTDPAENLITACADDFANACHGLAETSQPCVAVVTGFFIPTSDPPAGETDGPLGAVFLARALVPLGLRVVLASDGFCTRALQAGLEVCGLQKAVPLVTLPSLAACKGISAAAYWDAFRRRCGPLTHLVALERVGPNYASLAEPAFAEEVPEGSRDRCFTMRGRDVTPHMSPAHWLFEAAVRAEPRIATIGIGDGGNEIGMGKIPWQVIRRNIPRGGLVACRVATDHLLVCGTSNWGAYGLAAGVRVLRYAQMDRELFDVERERRLLEVMVEHGPLVDGVRGVREATVDGLSFERYGEVLKRLRGFSER